MKIPTSFSVHCTSHHVVSLLDMSSQKISTSVPFPSLYSVSPFTAVLYIQSFLRPAVELLQPAAGFSAIIGLPQV